MNVLVIKSNYGRTGGAETLLSSLLRHLDRERFKLTLVKLSHDPRYKLPALGDAAALAINEKTVRWRNSFSAAPALYRIKKVIHDQDIDVVYTHDMRADLVGRAMTAMTRAVWVSQIHGWLGPTARLKTRFHEWIDSRLIPAADMVLVGSEKLRSVMEARCRRLAVGVVPNSVDAEALKVAPARVRALRRELGPGESEMLMGTVGRLHRGKGHHILLRAFARLRRQYPRLRCLLVGEGPCRKELEALARELRIAEAVTFTGYRESIIDCLAALDVFVTCSLTESLPITVLEAMVLGRPVVATDVGDLRTVLDDGKAGLVVEPNSVEAVVRAVERLLDRPPLRERLARQGRKRVLAKYSVEQAARQIERHLTAACHA
ncbi:MAG: glycosyltransferase family 4 protein [Sedimentisphaerales bacterium]|nr:glycosyltransferase family 4 protein [Sedimentisphaerales bacterium]